MPNTDSLRQQSQTVESVMKIINTIVGPHSARWPLLWEDSPSVVKVELGFHTKSLLLRIVDAVSSTSCRCQQLLISEVYCIMHSCGPCVKKKRVVARRYRIRRKHSSYSKWCFYYTYSLLFLTYGWLNSWISSNPKHNPHGAGNKKIPLCFRL